MLSTNTKKLPVWLYWEGDLPEWISECRKTVYAHMNNIKLLNAEQFNALRDTDLDIQLDDLYVAHRADYIRAFLLARFGGLWIYSDCIVLKSLDPLMAVLEDCEFLGYRERSGEVTNNFMGAAANSKIAADYYTAVCHILRSGKSIEWLTLGSKALTATLDNGNSWHELHVNNIQPICWSDPGAFFQQRADEDHEKIVNPDSYCYMLSANMSGGYIADNPKPDILEENTFFSYLLRRSGTKTSKQAEAKPDTIMNSFSTIAYRENTDDDRWIIPEVIDMDMYRVKSVLAGLEPDVPSYVIDCGAHIGAFSIMCASYLKNADVTSFEPNPDSFSYLNSNAGRFQKIRALNKAVGISDGTLNLYSPDQLDWSGRWTTIPNANESVLVESVDLFSFINALDKEVFILKLDIEGYEELLIESSQANDLQKIKTIIVETHTDHFNHQKLKDFGYTLLFNPEISSARQFVYLRN